MNEILIIVVTAFITITAYSIGLKNGQRIVNNQPIELPKIEPVKAIKNAMAVAEANEKEKNFEVILENIENYDGTGKNQKEVK